LYQILKTKKKWKQELNRFPGQRNIPVKHIKREPRTPKEGGVVMNIYVENIWEEFSIPLRSFIKKRVDNDQDVEDILQNVFYKI
jgi:hypothetical protein